MSTEKQCTILETDWTKLVERALVIYLGDNYKIIQVTISYNMVNSATSIFRTSLGISE